MKNKKLRIFVCLMCLVCFTNLMYGFTDKIPLLGEGNYVKRYGDDRQVSPHPQRYIEILDDRIILKVNNLNEDITELLENDYLYLQNEVGGRYIEHLYLSVLGEEFDGSYEDIVVYLELQEASRSLIGGNLYYQDSQGFIYFEGDEDENQVKFAQDTLISIPSLLVLPIRLVSTSSQSSFLALADL